MKLLRMTEPLSESTTTAERGNRHHPDPAVTLAKADVNTLANLRNSMFGLLIAIVICFSAAALGGIVTGPAIGDW